MTNMLWYLVEAAVISALLFAVFKLIQRFMSFGWQRASLLFIPLLSAFIVWLKVIAISETNLSYHIPVYELESVSVSAGSTVPVEAFDYALLIPYFYWIGVLVMCTFVIWNLYKVLTRFRSSEKTKIADFKVIELNNEVPFSFFRFIQLPSGLSESEREIIFQHETIHARKFHSADRLYFELAHCFMWFNPIFVLMKRELIHVHEYQVDEIMYVKYRAGYMQFLLAYSLGTSSSIYLLTNQFMTKLTLIKRIKIMKNTSKKLVIAAIVIPVVAGALTLVSFTGKVQDSKTKKPVVSAAVAENKPKPMPLPEKEEKVKTVESKQLESKESEKSGKFIEPMPVFETKFKEETRIDEDKSPEFIGGASAMSKYFSNNLRYPEEAAKSKITGKVYVKFVVTETGKVTGASVQKGINGQLDAEALRVVSGMPNWSPAIKDGKEVKAEMVLPVAFNL